MEGAAFLAFEGLLVADARGAAAFLTIELLAVARVVVTWDGAVFLAFEGPAVPRVVAGEEEAVFLAPDGLAAALIPVTLGRAASAATVLSFLVAAGPSR